VFDRLRRIVGVRHDQARQPRGLCGPPDLAALPARAARVGGLGAVPLDLISGYTGIEVTAVRPLEQLGPEAAGMLGSAVRRRAREAGMGAPGLEPGEVVRGQNAARTARFRAAGRSEEELAMMQAMIGEQVHRRALTGWTVDLADGRHLSVVLADRAEPGNPFDSLAAEYAADSAKAGMEYRQENLFVLGVDRLVVPPYEAYYETGRLAAADGRRVAAASGRSLGTLDLRGTLAAFAFLALHSLDGG
jgi:hypothetical protein